MQHRTTSEGGSPSLFGAKITGGGSGGTVCVIGKNCARSSEEIVEVTSRGDNILSTRHSVVSLDTDGFSPWTLFRFSRGTRLPLGTCPSFSTDRLRELRSLAT
jgi:hypothetical protein